MAWFDRLANLVRRRDLTDEIDEELQFHLDASTEENLARGMSADQARRDALRRFGARTVVRERVRDANILGGLERLWQDLRHGARVFAKHPGLTAIAVMSIAFGTGANVAIFSVADALLLRPLPIPQPFELISIGSKVRNGPIYWTAASYRDYQDIRDRARSFEGVTAYAYETVALTLRPGDSPHVRFGTFISHDFFRVLRVSLQAGREFRPAEESTPDLGTVAILSDALWRAEFAADPAVIGRHIRVSGVEFTVVGIAPQSFPGIDRLLRDSVFVPITMMPRVANAPRRDLLEARDVRIMTLKARLRDGVTMRAAKAELLTIGQELERSYPDTNANQTLIAQTELEHQIERRPLNYELVLILTLLSVSVYCVACANVAGLLASRGPARAREMALRLAIGANRGRLVRQLVTESVGIAVAGGIAGIAVGWVGIALLGQIQYPTELITHPRFHLDTRAMVVGLVIAIASAILVGLGPAVQTTRVDLVTNLKSNDRSTNTRHRLTARSVLVTVQVALSLVLVTIAVFSFQIFQRELNRGPGFRTTQMTMINVSPGRSGYSDPESARFFTRLLESARVLPGVRSASVTSAMPMFSFQFTPALPEEDAIPQGQTVAPAWSNEVDERYFDTMEIPLLKGRVFTTTDDATAPAVAVVNDTLARRYWPSEEPIGKRLRLLEPGAPLVEIVGVVTTTIYGLPGGLPQDAIYFPYRQRPRGEMTLLTATAAASADLLEPVRNLLRQIDRDVPLSDGQTIEAFYGTRVTAAGNVLVRLVAGMGLMGMTLTMVGLYGLVSYAVSRRTREIGIRIAIGATYTRILNMILRQGMAPAWAGLATGLILSAGFMRISAHRSPFREQMDARTYYIVVPLVIAVTLAAAFVPARRAAQVNPTVALRTE
jgi:putative ABC transport system permease protein